MNGKANTINLSSACTPVKNLNTVSSGDAYVRQWGRVTHVHVWFVTKNEYPAWSTQTILTGCPHSWGSAGHFSITTDDYNTFYNACFNITDKGVAELELRSKSIPAGVLIKTCATYISDLC